MASFDWRENIEDSLKDGVVITIGATGIFFGLKTLNVVKPPNFCNIQKMDQRVNITKTTKLLWSY